MKRTRESVFYRREFSERYSITNQRDLRRAFWEDYPSLDKRKLPNGDRKVDTRCAFVDYVDMMQRNGTISPELAQRATLD